MTSSRTRLPSSISAGHSPTSKSVCCSSCPALPCAELRVDVRKDVGEARSASRTRWKSLMFEIAQAAMNKPRSSAMRCRPPDRSFRRGEPRGRARLSSLWSPQPEDRSPANDCSNRMPVSGAGERGVLHPGRGRPSRSRHSGRIGCAHCGPFVSHLGGPYTLLGGELSNTNPIQWVRHQL
jgi:hypothetical protein